MAQYQSWTKDNFWQVCAKNAPWRFRWLGKSLSMDELPEWLKEEYRWQPDIGPLLPSDKIWPFSFNENFLGMRKGYVVIRNGKPICGVLTVVS